MTAARQQGSGEQLDLFDEALKATLRHGGPGLGRPEARPSEEWQADTAWQRERALTRGLMEKIASSANLNEAYKRVKTNHGAPGVDGMTVADLRPWIAWCNRRSCKSWSRCSTRVFRRRALASARDGERIMRCSEPANTSPTG